MVVLEITLNFAASHALATHCLRYKPINPLFVAQVKLATWGALMCALAALANMRTHEADIKQIMSSFTCVSLLDAHPWSGL